MKTVPRVTVKHCVQLLTLLISCTRNKDIAASHIMFNVSCFLYGTAVICKRNGCSKAARTILKLANAHDITAAAVSAFSLGHFVVRCFTSPRTTVKHVASWSVTWIVLVYDRSWSDELKENYRRFVVIKMHELGQLRQSTNKVA